MKKNIKIIAILTGITILSGCSSINNENLIVEDSKNNLRFYDENQESDEMCDEHYELDKERMIYEHLENEINEECDENITKDIKENSNSISKNINKSKYENVKEFNHVNNEHDNEYDNEYENCINIHSKNSEEYEECRNII